MTLTSTPPALSRPASALSLPELRRVAVAHRQRVEDAYQRAIEDWGDCHSAQARQRAFIRVKAYERQRRQAEAWVRRIDAATDADLDRSPLTILADYAEWAIWAAVLAGLIYAAGTFLVEAAT